MRGEKSAMRGARCWTPGSPPHARGKAGAFTLRAEVAGITPACAGKSGVLGQPGAGLRDHPRMRGEKIRRGTTPDECVGSPPHARGKGPYAFWWTDCTGITPACAGKRKRFCNLLNMYKDHPRMRGEKFFISSHAPVNGGSPPHARGKD